MQHKMSKSKPVNMRFDPDLYAMVLQLAELRYFGNVSLAIRETLRSVCKLDNQTDLKKGDGNSEEVK